MRQSLCVLLSSTRTKTGTPRFLERWRLLSQSPSPHPLTKRPDYSGNEIDIAPTSPASPEMGGNLPLSRPLRGCTDRVLLVVN